MRGRAIVTGASSGLGEGMAGELARRGWSVALLARRGDLLDRECRALRDRGCRVAWAACDVADRASVEAAVARTAEELGGPFDLAIANAGAGDPTHAGRFDVDAAERIIRVNVLGTIYLFGAVVPGMIERRRGRFVGIASLAGYRGLPTASAYSASKAAVRSFLQASRIELAQFGVGVTTVNPGFVATAMTERNRFRMPFLMSVDQAVPRIVDGIERGARVVEFPLPMSWLMSLARALPGAVYERLMRRAARMKGVKR